MEEGKTQDNNNTSNDGPVDIEEKIKSPIFIIGAILFLVAFVGAILIWITAGAPKYEPSMIFLAVIFNLVGHVLNLPVVFAWTSSITFFFLAIIIQSAAGSSGKYLAGVILLSIGELGSFITFPVQRKNFNVDVSFILAILAAVCYIIGGSIAASFGSTLAALASQLFFLVPLAIASFVFQSRSLKYTLLSLSAGVLIYLSLASRNQHKSNAVVVFAWLGSVLSAAYVIGSVYMFSKDSDVPDSE